VSYFQCKKSKTFYKRCSISKKLAI